MTIQEHNCPITKKTIFSINQTIGGKNHKFHTVNYNLDWDETVYKYRAISKCRAGFMVISEGENRLVNAVGMWKKNALQTLQVQLPNTDLYVNALAIKANKFVIVENSILENIKIGTIHSQFPKMADHGHWRSIGSKTWADNAYKLEDSFKNMTIEIIK